MKNEREKALSKGTFKGTDFRLLKLRRGSFYTVNWKINRSWSNKENYSDIEKCSHRGPKARKAPGSVEINEQEEE